MKIRRFRKQDASKVSYLIRKCNNEVLSKCYPKGVTEFFLRRQTPAWILKKAKEREYWVAVEGDRIFGLAGIKDNEVKTVFVNPRHHKKGIGKRLLEKIQGIAEKRKIKTLLIYATPYAEEFYKRLGFKRIRKEIHRTKGKGRGVRFAVIRMEKKL